MADFKPKFMEVFSVLKSEQLNDPVFEYTDESRWMFEQILDHHVTKGKLSLGLSIIDSYKLLKSGEELTDDEVFLACALGWCLEGLRDCFVAVDGVNDDSNSCDQPFTFKLPKMGMLKASVGSALHNQKHILRILHRHFKGKPYYVDLLDLFNEVEFLTSHGRMLDWVTTLMGEKDLSKFSLHLYRRIIEFKTAYYSFYLPDDYLRCFGDPDVIDKIGTDIRQFRCTWLVVKALELSNEDQKKILYDNYGKDDATCVEKVKELYEVLKLQDIYLEYGKSSYGKIISSIEAHPHKELQAVLKSFLAKQLHTLLLLHTLNNIMILYMVGGV